MSRSSVYWETLENDSSRVLSVTMDIATVLQSLYVAAAATVRPLRRPTKEVS